MSHNNNFTTFSPSYQANRRSGINWYRLVKNGKFDVDMRFHVINLPHTQTTKAFGQCAYTQKVRKFCDMMTARGHEVYLYASEENEAKVTELVTCITKFQIDEMLKEYPWWPNQYYKIPFKDDFELWHYFNNTAINQIRKRVQKGDFILMSAGGSQEAIWRAFPYNTVEFAVGYEGIRTKFRVFESYPWMHHVYGLKGIKAGNPDDEVIPNYYDVNEFPFSFLKLDYLLFMSRPVRGKGLNTALRIAKETQTKLVVAGNEEVKGDFVEYVGYADFNKRGELMSKAKALLAPTLGIEPFGGVVAEAQLCGTPVITTDWGAFTETVEQERTGFRCRTMDQFIEATKKVNSLDRRYIHERAKLLFSMEVAAEKYEKYFERIKPQIDRAVFF